MAMFDLPLEQLQTYRPKVAEPGDFDTFWRDTITQAGRHDLNLRLEQIDGRASLHDTWDVTFAGYGGHDIKGWLHAPAGHDENLPLVVVYHGYSGGRGMPFPWPWVSAGYAQLTLDTRGQGWNSASIFDATPDPESSHGQNIPGVMTKGILDPEDYYYRRVYVDAVRLLEVATQLPQIDQSKIYLTGASQGGGLTIAAAALAPLVGIEIAGALPDVPFLCHFRRGSEIVDSFPYKELGDHFKARPHEIEQGFRTLSYFDGVNLAKRASCPTLWSVALMDATCPPSTVYAAFNAWGGDDFADKDIKVYPYNGHEGGREIQRWEQLGWLRDRVSDDAVKPVKPRRGRR